MAKKDKATRLFEDDLNITGKHATHLKFLGKDICGCIFHAPYRVCFLVSFDYFAR